MLTIPLRLYTLLRLYKLRFLLLVMVFGFSLLVVSQETPRGAPSGSASAHGVFILDPPSRDETCSGMPAECYSRHLIPTLICTGKGTPAGYNCNQAGAGEPYVKGAVFYVRWDQINPSNGTYDFSIPDTRAQPWIAAGKLVAYDFIPTSQGSFNDVTPAWYASSAVISAVSQTSGVIALQTTADMGFLPGQIAQAAGLKIQIKGTGTTLDGNGTTANPGVWVVCDHNTTGCQDPTSQTIYAIGSGNNISTVHQGSVGNPQYGTGGSACGSGVLPVEWGPNFMKAWKAVMKEVVAHYGSNNSVAYIRFGLGIGGENIPNHGTQLTTCQRSMLTAGFSGASAVSAPWPVPTSGQWPPVAANWIGYVKNMLQYEQSLHSSKVIGTTISPIRDAPEDFSTADQTAVNAVTFGVGFGNQGLQKSDPANYAAGDPCLGGNWCANFVKYAGKVPLELQTLNYSDPSDRSVVGSLAKTLPFATSLHVNILELYVDDWMCTYDASWIGGNAYSACQSAGYPAAFDNAAGQIN